MAANEIDGDFLEQSDVLDSVPIPDPAVIFVEGDVEHPGQAIVGLPMSADRLRRDFRLVGTAGQEVADFRFGFAGPVELRMVSTAGTLFKPGPSSMDKPFCQFRTMWCELPPTITFAGKLREHELFR